MGRIMWDLIILVQRRSLKKIFRFIRINFLQKYYFCHVRNIYLFNNLLFLSQIELFSLKFLFKHFYSNAPFSFLKVFSKNVCNLPSPPLPESDSAFSKTLTPVPSFNLQCSHARMNFLGHFVTLCILFNKT